MDAARKSRTSTSSTKKTSRAEEKNVMGSVWPWQETVPHITSSRSFIVEGDPFSYVINRLLPNGSAVKNQVVQR